MAYELHTLRRDWLLALEAAHYDADRLAATRHTGDALAGVVVLSAESTRVTRWAMYALAELDALMDVEELAV